jgi:hypothetical protein
MTGNKLGITAKGIEFGKQPFADLPAVRGNKLPPVQACAQPIDVPFLIGFNIEEKATIQEFLAVHAAWDIFHQLYARENYGKLLEACTVWSPRLPTDLISLPLRIPESQCAGIL